MNNTIQNTNNPNFCAKVSFINHIKKDAKKLATILEEKTKEYPNSKIEINADHKGRVMSARIDNKYYEFSTDGSISLEYDGDEEFVAEKILKLFNLHLYEEKARKLFQEFCLKINNEATKLDLKNGCERTVFDICEKETMKKTLEENIEGVRAVNLANDPVYRDIFYKNTSDICK